ncbi:MAG: N,N-dimethylformamidase large subunit [Gammaproteobacteria bacterium]|nr:N,N-dimethylformamidase large subunit [Gammaproteobacteria bacterium]
MIPLVGYADRFSAAPGQSISFKVSSTLDVPYTARLVRMGCGDPNPDGPGMDVVDMSTTFSATLPSRYQHVVLGSYVEVVRPVPVPTTVTLSATIWPTLPDAGCQAVIGLRDDGLGNDLTLAIDGARGVTAVINGTRVAIDKPVRNRAWYRVSLSYDARTGDVTLRQSPLRAEFGVDDDGSRSAVTQKATLQHARARIAAFAGQVPGGHFNGKIEDPHIADGLHDDASMRTVALWDFSQSISGAQIVDRGPHELHGHTVNLPARAVTGSNWNGAEHCWRHAPSEYGAIHFHDDDLYDCEWDDDFALTLPGDLASGPYAMELLAGGERETIPFYVRPKPGAPKRNICVLAPTFTYIVYGNYQRGVTNAEYKKRAEQWGARPWNPDEHPQFGLSTYNFHRDGSGIGYASRLRPMLNMRPGFLSYVDQRGSGLRHYPADTHLFTWLNQNGYDYDVITDEDLDRVGVSLIEDYDVVLTMSHPEYHTTATHDAVRSYLDIGGRLMYLGGNGFYWRVACHPDFPGAVEVRRAEGGIRAWAAEPGEYFHAFDGEYGGLWRRNGRPPQSLVGVGFTAQGMFEGTYYQRAPGASDPRTEWIFSGVDGNSIGNFGLSGGGAAGFELDRYDTRLGSAANGIVLATSVEHPEHFVLVPEELLTHVSTWPGEPIDALIRADMVYFQTPTGGEVFSVGSITYCGSLLHNDGDNNISRITSNVLNRFAQRGG